MDTDYPDEDACKTSRDSTFCHCFGDEVSILVILKMQVPCQKHACTVQDLSSFSSILSVISLNLNSSYYSTFDIDPQLAFFVSPFVLSSPAERRTCFVPPLHLYFYFNLILKGMCVVQRCHSSVPTVYICILQRNLTRP